LSVLGVNGRLGSRSQQGWLTAVRTIVWDLLTPTI
jgi:hypothetical protein